MYPRVVPNINENLLLKILNKSEKIENIKIDKNLFFFDSGREALKFLLKLKFKNKKIGIQNFTCSIVKDAILESNNIPVFLDVEKDLFSTSLDEIKKHEIDVLILTHLFGIPNAEYFKIKDYCSKNNICLIDDLSQTILSKVNGKILEDYSEYYIYSFAFDKPIGSLSGGALHVPQDEKEKVKIQYDKLPKRTENIGYLNLKISYIYYLILKSLLLLERTNTIFERMMFFLLPLSFIRNNKLIYFFYEKKINIIIFKIENRLKNIFKKNKEIEIKRISNIEKYYLLKQLKNYNILDRKLIYIKAKEKILKLNGKIEEIKLRDNIEISYGIRFPILVFNQKEVVKKLLENKIEAGNHNWSEVLNEKYSSKISKEITEKIINIPIWGDEIWD